MFTLTFSIQSDASGGPNGETGVSSSDFVGLVVEEGVGVLVPGYWTQGQTPWTFQTFDWFHLLIYYESHLNKEFNAETPIWLTIKLPQKLKKTNQKTFINLSIISSLNIMIFSYTANHSKSILRLTDDLIWHIVFLKTVQTRLTVKWVTNFYA